MTLFIITLTDRFALVSQDTMVAMRTDGDATHRPTVSGEDLARDPLAADHHAGYGPKRLVAFASKFSVLPHLKMVVGGAGDFRFIESWALTLSVTPARGPVEIDSVATGLLQQYAERIGGAPPAMIYHIGFDDGARRPVGFVYNSADGFKSTQILARDRTGRPMHSMHPIWSDKHPDYADLCSRSDAAGYGGCTDYFHVRVAVNLFESYPGAGMGGQLHTARIDADGISVRVAHEFPGYREQLAAFRPQLGCLPSIVSYAGDDHTTPV